MKLRWSQSGDDSSRRRFGWIQVENLRVHAPGAERDPGEATPGEATKRHSSVAVAPYQIERRRSLIAHLSSERPL